MRKELDMEMYTGHVDCWSRASFSILNYMGLENPGVLMGVNNGTYLLMNPHECKLTPSYIDQPMIRLFNMKVDYQEFSEEEEVWKEIVDSINKDIPIAIFCNTKNLPFTSFLRDFHMTIIAGYSSEPRTVLIRDTLGDYKDYISFDQLVKAMTLSPELMIQARATQPFKIVTIIPRDTEMDLYQEILMEYFIKNMMIMKGEVEPDEESRKQILQLANMPVGTEIFTGWSGIERLSEIFIDLPLHIQKNFSGYFLEFAIKRTFLLDTMMHFQSLLPADKLDESCKYMKRVSQSWNVMRNMLIKYQFTQNSSLLTQIQQRLKQVVSEEQIALENYAIRGII
ncbi:hypothetical protein J2Z48_002148 [Croceifilum oryzae]|uniref:Butirosin biosynthesis protein H N-terminal domain-containing protein n=1 Tax=Croceifilum oryzae TaxID=1553429 RepID=A0AAJ1TKT9_9BACL|nr:hypothetical protein [Croceifilum oryzae]MDQ0417964.1 hypothetical protein [Croceifilum oryzae]